MKLVTLVLIIAFIGAVATAFLFGYQTRRLVRQLEKMNSDIRLVKEFNEKTLKENASLENQNKMLKEFIDNRGK